MWFWRNNTWLSVSEFIQLSDSEEVVNKKIRFRTLGDITITGGIESDADTLEKNSRGSCHRQTYGKRQQIR